MPNRTPRSRFDEIVSNFGACPRCSLFLVGYRNGVGGDNLRAAVDLITNDWLELAWTPVTRELAHKAFGRQVDVNSFYYESCCPVCFRVFIIQADERETQPPAFRIETRPHAPH